MIVEYEPNHEPIKQRKNFRHFNFYGPKRYINAENFVNNNLEELEIVSITENNTNG